jgi:hypothetical protein
MSDTHMYFLIKGFSIKTKLVLYRYVQTFKTRFKFFSGSFRDEIWGNSDGKTYCYYDIGL